MEKLPFLKHVFMERLYKGNGEKEKIPDDLKNIFTKQIYLKSRKKML